MSSPPRAHVVSPLRPCRAKRGANERTTRRADGRGRHLCLMDRLKVRKTTRGPPPEFRPNHLCQDKKRKDPSVPFPSQNTRVGSLVSSPRSLGFDKVVRTKAGSDGFKGFLKNVSLIFARKTRWRRVELESPQTLFLSRGGEEIGNSSFTCSWLGWVRLPNCCKAQFNYSLQKSHSDPPLFLVWEREGRQVRHGMPPRHTLCPLRGCMCHRHSVGLRLPDLTENTCYGRRLNQNGNVFSQRSRSFC